MPGSIHRNLVVKFFGQPDLTEGSVNEPRERQEHGIRFNEKWSYAHPRRDPAEAVERVIYWRRYDFLGSMVRTSADGDWRKDDALPEVLAKFAPDDVYVPSTV